MDSFHSDPLMLLMKELKDVLAKELKQTDPHWERVLQESTDALQQGRKRVGQNGNVVTTCERKLRKIRISGVAIPVTGIIGVAMIVVASVTQEIRTSGLAIAVIGISGMVMMVVTSVTQKIRTSGVAIAMTGISGMTIVVVVVLLAQKEIL